MRLKGLTLLLLARAAHGIPHDPSAHNTAHSHVHNEAQQPQQSQPSQQHAGHRAHTPHAPPPSPQPLPLQPPPPRPPVARNASDTVSYAYEDEDDDDSPSDASSDDTEVLDKVDMEEDLWKELDIDEDRDEPILKVTVVLLTAIVVVAGVRKHCCHRYRAVPSDERSPRQRADDELAFAPDFVLPGRPARFSRRSNDAEEGWSLDVFSVLARKLQL